MVESRHCARRPRNLGLNPPRICMPLYPLLYVLLVELDTPHAGIRDHRCRTCLASHQREETPRDLQSGPARSHTEGQTGITHVAHARRNSWPYQDAQIHRHGYGALGGHGWLCGALRNFAHCLRSSSQSKFHPPVHGTFRSLLIFHRAHYYFNGPGNHRFDFHPPTDTPIPKRKALKILPIWLAEGLLHRGDNRCDCHLCSTPARLRRCVV